MKNYDIADIIGKIDEARKSAAFCVRELLERMPAEQITTEEQALVYAYGMPDVKQLINMTADYLAEIAGAIAAAEADLQTAGTDETPEQQRLLPMPELEYQIAMRVGKRGAGSICSIISKLESDRVKGVQ